MLETCRMAGMGATFPVTEWSLRAMTGVGAPCREGTTRCSRSPWRRLTATRSGKKDGSASLIDEIVREGARRMLAEALQAEVDAYVAALAAERDETCAAAWWCGMAITSRGRC